MTRTRATLRPSKGVGPLVRKHKEKPPYTAERAIEIALGIDDHFDRFFFLKAYQEGNWDECKEYSGVEK